MKPLALLLASLSALVAIARLPVLAVDGTAQAGQAGLGDIVIGTGPLQSVYYLAGNALCRILVEEEAKRDRNGAPVRCGAAASAGSLVNIQALRTGSDELALLQSDVTREAVAGSGPFAGRPNDDLRVLFSLHTEPFQLLVPRNLGLKSFADLAGRKIDIGKPDTTPNRMFLTLMKIHGLTEASFSRVLQVPAAEEFTAFCNGDVEALGMMTGYPNAAFTGAIARCEGALLDLDTETDRRMIAATTAYRPVLIPKGTYPGFDRDVSTFGVVTIVCARSDMPDDTAYRIVRDVFERVGDLKAMHPALAGLDARRMAGEGITAPLHPGAMRYFAEKGLIGAAGDHFPEAP